MIENRPFLAFLTHLVLILGVVIVVVLTVVQFRYVERRVQY